MKYKEYVRLEKSLKNLIKKFGVFTITTKTEDPKLMASYCHLLDSLMHLQKYCVHMTEDQTWDDCKKLGGEE